MWGTALALNNLGVALREHGDAVRARTARGEFDIAPCTGRPQRDRGSIGTTLGRVALEQQDWPRATGLLCDSLKLWQEQATDHPSP